MSNLLLEVKMNRIRARTIFPQSVKIYEDLVVFRKRKWFKVDEMTVTYNHIAQATIKTGILFATLEVITSGGTEKPFVPHILKSHAAKAHKIIEQKIHRVHSTQVRKEEFQAEKDIKILKIEKSLSRLRELKRRGRLSNKEYEKKKKNILKEIG